MIAQSPDRVIAYHKIPFRFIDYSSIQSISYIHNSPMMVTENRQLWKDLPLAQDAVGRPECQPWRQALRADRSIALPPASYSYTRA